MDPNNSSGRDSTIHQQMESIYRLYAALASHLDAATGLGGKLLFVGEPTEASTQLLRAANIAGAASLAASADAAALRRVMRDGALDFVVTDLDEALRILKNEIRKKQPVAVGVSQNLRLIIEEMIERGVQPDLLSPELATAPECEGLVARGARIIDPRPLPLGVAFTVMPLTVSGQQAISAFDESLLDGLAAEDHLNRRWVRLAPRYLPSGARRLRSLARVSPPICS